MHIRVHDTFLSGTLALTLDDDTLTYTLSTRPDRVQRSCRQPGNTRSRLYKQTQHAAKSIYRALPFSQTMTVLPRQVRPRYFYLITRRRSQRQFLLRPCRVAAVSRDNPACTCRRSSDCQSRTSRLTSSKLRRT